MARGKNGQEVWQLRFKSNIIGSIPLIRISNKELNSSAKGLQGRDTACSPHIAIKVIKTSQTRWQMLLGERS